MRELKTLEELNNFITSYEKVAIDFYATWCGPCKVIGPYFQELSSLFPNIKFAKVDCDDFEVGDFAIQSLPTFVFFVNGTENERMIGANKVNLKDHLSKL